MKCGKSLIYLILIGFLIFFNLNLIQAIDLSPNIIIEENITINNSDNIFNIDMPNDLLYYKKKVQFMITTSVTAKKIEYINLNEKNPRWKTLCLHCREYGKYRDRKLTMVEGINNLLIRVMDNIGLYHVKNLTIVVNSVVPTIFKFEPRENQIINGSEFMIFYSSENLENITIYYGNESHENSSVLDCQTGKSKICRINLNLSMYNEQNIYYYFSINDNLNIINTKKTYVQVDTIVPEIIVYTPKENKSYEKIVYLNISVSEKSTIEYKDFTETKPVFRNLCLNCNTYGFFEKRSKSFSKGEHEFLFRATDKSGNSAVKSVNISID